MCHQFIWHCITLAHTSVSAFGRYKNFVFEDGTVVFEDRLAAIHELTEKAGRDVSNAISVGVMFACISLGVSVTMLSSHWITQAVQKNLDFIKMKVQPGNQRPER